MSRTAFVAAIAAFFLISGTAVAATDSATYTYDSQGRIQTVTYANGTTITYAYDSAGNRTTVTTTFEQRLLIIARHTASGITRRDGEAT
jgi:YD repeat-containing protein